MEKETDRTYKKEKIELKDLKIQIYSSLSCRFNCLIFTKELKIFDFKKIYLLDKDENLLADLARSLNLLFKSKVKKICFICCDLNSINLHNFLREKKISHYFNFAALKHVRSEETYESSIYMFKTNCIYPFNFGDLSNLGHIKKIFFISTDKAVYPLSVMGLTKKIMESNLSMSYSIIDEICFLS